jgi:cytochrome P450
MQIQWNFARIHDWLLDMTLRHGKTFRVSPFYAITIYFTADPKNVQHILQDQLNTYTKESMLMEAFGDLLGDGIFQVSHGPHAPDGGKSWAFQRKVAAQIFTRHNFRGYMERTFVSRGLELVSVLEKHATSGIAVDLQGYFFKLALDSIGLLGFGVDLGTLRSSSPRPFAEAFDGLLIDSFNRFVHLPSVILFSIRQVFPSFVRKSFGTWPLRLFTIERRMRKNLRIIDTFALDVIKQRREMRKRKQNGLDVVKKDCDTFDIPEGEAASTWNDFLTLFMDAEANSASGHLSDEFLRDVIMSFFIAGRDTTASTLSWLFLMLAKHPEIAQKLAAEVDKCCPVGSQPSFDKVKDTAMPYLNAVIWETLRLFPPVAASPKVAAADDVLPDGTFVPKGAEMVYMPYVMGRLEELWGADAEVFQPERWIPFSRPSFFKFPVFQAGPRICLGMEMALLEAKVTTVLLVQRFKVKLAREDTSIAYKLGPTICVRDGVDVIIDNRH